ncbi:hypothetical protein NEHOM01_1627 [Nematocida homosporus]|uniref:uncharacterized protein n=1 Tax=Nematocida homosporus TaxID=1912981 RepID=UPI00221FBB07|nr:uncharacterized protein NEHOM01_1627 [Nematocida homosporus]KAI5186674.1 hypothetical protein NEHOM01_1627 [Nematocida homosporus]
MIRALLIVSASGSLVYHKIVSPELVKSVEVDKVIALASTIYAGLEILEESQLCTREGKYQQVTFTYEKASLTTLRTATRLIFAVLHDNSADKTKIKDWVERIHSRYINQVLYNPLYSVEESITTTVFNDLF